MPTFERETLRNLYKSCNDVKLKERYHALYLYSLGYGKGEIALIVCRDEDTISAWIKQYEEEGNIENKPKTGGKRKLTEEIEKEVVDLVDKNNPSEKGFNVASWDCNELRKYLLLKYNVEVSGEAIRNVLKKNSFRYVKAEFLFTKRDEVERGTYIKALFSLLENLVKPPAVFFGDEMSSKLHPKNGYVWTRKKKVIIETNCSHQRAYVIAAVNPFNGKKVTVIEEKNNAEGFINFLKKLVSETKGNILLVLDNYRTHHSRLVQDFLNKHPRIKLFFQPKYSPDLNPTEWLWGLLRKKFLNNICFVDIEQMKKHLAYTLESLDPPSIIKTCNIAILEKHRIT